MENAIAIDLMTKHVQTQLNDTMTNFRWGLVDTPVGKELPKNIHVLAPSNQVRGIHTILRNNKTDRDEFVFYADRLAVLLMES